MPKKTKSTKKNPINKKIKIILVLIPLLALIGYLGYTVMVFENSKQNKEGFFVCNEDGTICELSEHIHADIAVSECGNEVEFPKEKGRTDEMHTHKERNYMHWHARINVDPETREPTGPDKDRVSVQAFLTQMDYEFPEACPDNPNPELTVTVNDNPVDEKLDYIWVDGDEIFIEYK